MENLFVARQPIYNKKLEVIGYELLYRNGDVSQAIFDDAKTATCETILNAFMDIGIDNLIGSALAFINLPVEFIIDDTLMPLSTEQSVLEILEDIEPTEAVINGLKRLKENGYKIALDDFCYDEKFIPFLELADFVKLDVLEHSGKELKQQIDMLKSYSVKLIAEKIETQEMKEECLALGFDYFQGFFFCKPQLVTQKRIPNNKMVVMNLLSKVNDPCLDFDEFQLILSQDASLSYKLLRYINSAMFSLRREVESIKDAIVLLGQHNVKKWLSLIALSKMDNDKPSELIVVALIRGRMCELLAEEMHPEITDQMFIVGLFSVLDALIDMPMEDLLDTVTLSADIKFALLNLEGKHGEILSLVLAYERLEFKEEQNSNNTHKINECYLNAITWADEAVQSLT